MDDLEELFNLNECVEWIVENEFNCVGLQFSNNLLKYSVSITKYLKNKQNVCSEFYTTISNCCSVDYLSSLHLNNCIKAIIRFGKNCFTSLPPTIKELPVLFIFENTYSKIKNNLINNFLNELNSDEEFLIISESSYFTYISEILNNLDKKVILPKWIQYSKLWSFTKKIQPYFVELNNDDLFKNNQEQLYNLILPKKLSELTKLVYIGDDISIFYKILSLINIVYVNVKDNEIENISSQKNILKRISLIEKTKKANKIGFIFTHSYPNINEQLVKIIKLCKKTNKKPYFLSLVRTNDQFRLGNFPSIETMVVVKNCFCSYLINSTKLHFPLIDLIEFEISCGLKRNFGKIVWNEECESDEEFLNNLDENENKLSIVLDERKNIIIESIFGKQNWYGLEVNPGCDEASDLKKGLAGLALGYKGEGQN